MFSVLAEDNKHNLSVLSSNIQSIHSKLSELEAFVDKLSKPNFKFNIICLQESWLSENDDLSLIQLKRYDCIAQGKSCSIKGGLILEWTTSLDTSSRTLFVREDVSPDVHVTSNVELHNNVRLLMNVELRNYVISRQIVERRVQHTYSPYSRIRH